MSKLNSKQSKKDQKKILPSFHDTFPNNHESNDSDDDDSNSNDNDESKDSLEEDDDDDLDSIKTEEDVEEIETPEITNLLKEGGVAGFSEMNSLFKGKSIPGMTDKTKKGLETRSLKILKSIIEPIDSSVTFEQEMKKVEERMNERLKKNPQLKKVYYDNMEILIDGKNIATIMESVDDNLTISKETKDVMKAICKVFLSELVHETQKVHFEQNTSNEHLTPKEVVIAYRRLMDKGSVPNINKTPFFCDH